MKNLKLFFRLKSTRFSELFSILFGSLLIIYFISLFLAFIGFHYSFIFFVLFGLLFLLGFFWLLFNFSCIFSKKIFFVSVLLLLWIFFALNFSVPTIFSGRDQGSLSDAAVYLSQNHKLTFSFPAQREFFEIYGPGKALNFPGFFYTKEGELTTQFPLGYVSFLASFYAIFGLFGIKLANIVAFLFFIGSFYFVSLKILGKKDSFLPVFLALSSFVFSWFSKFSLSENLALALLWFSVWKLMSWWEQKNKNDLLLLFLSLGFLLFVRLESLIFILIVFCLLIFKEKFNFFKKSVSFSVKLVWAITAFFFLLTFFVNQNFYRVIIKSFLPEGGESVFSSSGFFGEIIYTFNILSIYSLVIFLAFSILGIFFLLKKRQTEFLLPFFVVFPTFIFILDPSISDDHPWMLRRFLYSLVPVFFLYSIVFLKKFFPERKFFLFFSSLLIVYNLMVTLPYITFIPQGNLMKEAEKISLNFSQNDLVLVDRLATGNPYAMLPGPLHAIFKKQAVYFFNVNDFDRINKDRFERIFFIIPDNSLEFYLKNNLSKKLIPKKEYKIETEALVNTDEKKKLNLPVREKQIVFGKIYEYIK